MVSSIRLTAFLFLTIIGISDLCSQGYIPTIVEGNHWTIRRPRGHGIVDYFDFELRCDTLINGKQYLMQWSSSGYLGYLHGYFREDTVLQEIYYIPTDTVAEILLYSFRLEVGDTLWNLAWGPGVSGAIVDSVGTEILFGSERRVIYTSFTNLIEGVGSLEGLAYWNWLPMWYHVYDFYETEHTCEFVTPTEDATESSLDIYPNPFHGTLTVVSDSNEFERFTLTDVYGNLVLEDLCHGVKKIDLQYLNIGVYFLRTEGGEVFKLIKQ